MYYDNRPKIIALILILLLVLAALTVTVTSATEPPAVSARAAALYVPDTDTFLYEKNAATRLPMASTTKIMTALVAAEEGDPAQKIKVPAEATGIEGSSLYLKPGEVLTLNDLLYGMLLNSANDAAAAIAIAISGDIASFADRMNDRAAELGLSDTHFENPHGLDGPTHYTTARDLARIAAAALANDTLRPIFATFKKTLEEGDVPRTAVNHNKLLRLYDGADGVKTGFTKKSGRCLVGSATREGLTLVSVTLDAPDDWDDHARLLDFGFATMEHRVIAEPGQYSYDLPIVGGTEQTVRVENTLPFELTCRKTDAPVTAQVRMLRYTAAPVQEGDILGEVLFLQEGITLGSVPLTAQKTVQPPPQKHRFFFLR